MYKTNFYMIIRRLLFLLFIVAVHIPAEAQVKNINITVRKAEDLNSKDVAPWPNVIVYGFFNASKAKRLREEKPGGGKPTARPMFHSLNRSTTLWARPTRTATA